MGWCMCVKAKAEMVLGREDILDKVGAEWTGVGANVGECVMCRCMGLKAKAKMVQGRRDILDKVGVGGLMGDCG